jgi:xylitol oxidase
MESSMALSSLTDALHLGSAARARLVDGARRNWAGNLVFEALSLDSPDGLASLRASIGQSAGVRALGTAHSFNGIADYAGGTQVSLKDYQGDEAVVFSSDTATVTVSAGMTYAQVAKALTPHGLALHNLASLPHITVAGATQTGTHGSGSRNGNLATAVTGLEMVTADGRLAQLSAETHGSSFDGMVVALGALGIVTRVTLRVQPAFQVRQQVFEHLPFETLTANLQDIFSSAYSVSAFTNWQSREAAQVWLKHRDDSEDLKVQGGSFYGATVAREFLHPLPGHSAEHCTAQLLEPGPWDERLPHFRSDFTPSSGAELQTEYFVALEDGPAAINAVAQLGDRIAPLLFVSELRTIAADALWLSPCYRRQSLALHFTWHSREQQVLALLPAIEAALEPFAARPHWAKLFTIGADRLDSLYPKLAAFRELRASFDPNGKFRNQFLDGLGI